MNYLNNIFGLDTSVVDWRRIQHLFDKISSLKIAVYIVFGMGKLLSTLHSPQLVADFQRVCGVSVLESEPLIDNGTGKSCNDFDISKLSDTVNISKRKRKNGNKTDLEKELKIGKSQSDLHSGSMKFKVTNRFLYYIFCFGSSLGNEIFYICFFPFWFWNIDGYVGRRLCFFWGLFMYLGQATKDVLRIPRPASPPVIRMEDRYALEYGMPSTHAMVGAGIPFGIFFLTKERYIVSILSFWHQISNVLMTSKFCVMKAIFPQLTKHCFRLIL